MKFHLIRFFAFVILLLGFGAGRLPGQVQVDLKIGRELHVAYEPVKLKVTLVNQSGKDLELKDTPERSWFGFSLTTDADDPVNTRGERFEVPGVTLRAGETLSRTVDLRAFYAVPDFGTFRVRAFVYQPDTGKYQYSAQVMLTVSRGITIWERTVGTPDGQGQRKMELVTLRQPNYKMLYVRLGDADYGTTLACLPLGKLVAEDNPQVLMDSASRLHVLYAAAPQIFCHSVIRPDGETTANEFYRVTMRGRPGLVDSTGGVRVRGGEPFSPNATTGALTLSPTLEAGGAVLSERPADAGM